LTEAALQAVDLAELPAADDRPLEVVAIRRLEVERAVVLLGVAVEGAEDVVASAGDARVAHLGVRACGEEAEGKHKVKCKVKCIYCCNRELYRDEWGESG